MPEALGRILSPLRLPVPPLQQVPSSVFEPISSRNTPDSESKSQARSRILGGSSELLANMSQSCQLSADPPACRYNTPHPCEGEKP